MTIMLVDDIVDCFIINHTKKCIDVWKILLCIEVCSFCSWSPIRLIPIPFSWHDHSFYKHVWTFYPYYEIPMSAIRYHCFNLGLWRKSLSVWCMHVLHFFSKSLTKSWNSLSYHYPLCLMCMCSLNQYCAAFTNIIDTTTQYFVWKVEFMRISNFNLKHNILRKASLGLIWKRDKINTIQKVTSK